MSRLCVGDCGCMKEHGKQIYATKSPDFVSWYQPRPALSLDWIARAGVATDAEIVDVGGGASTLVDNLLQAGYARCRCSMCPRRPWQ